MYNFFKTCAAWTTLFAAASFVLGMVCLGAPRLSVHTLGIYMLLGSALTFVAGVSLWTSPDSGHAHGLVEASKTTNLWLATIANWMQSDSRISKHAQDFDQSDVRTAARAAFQKAKQHAELLHLQLFECLFANYPNTELKQRGDIIRELDRNAREGMNTALDLLRADLSLAESCRNDLARVEQALAHTNANEELSGTVKLAQTLMRRRMYEACQEVLQELKTVLLANG